MKINTLDIYLNVDVFKFIKRFLNKKTKLIIYYSIQ